MAESARGRATVLRRQDWAVPRAWDASLSRVPVAKRALDLLGAAGGALALSPVFALIALAIKLDSPGPVLFRQERVGRGGVPFAMYKFRTMIDGNSSQAHEAYVKQMIHGAGDELRNGDGTYKLEGDTRITRVGRLLRATSFDEFPQLINVLRGEMSLVGPRPALQYEVDEYENRHRRRLDTRPGLTGLWQVSGRNRTTFEQMIDLDLAYIDNWSLATDLRIIGRTFSVIFTDRGA